MTIVPSFSLVAGAAAVAFFAGSGLGVVGTSKFYAPRLELEQAKVREFSGAITRQNEAVDALGEETKKLRADVQEAQRKARERSAGHQAAAMQIMSLPLPTGVDQCTAASTLIRKELSK